MSRSNSFDGGRVFDILTGVSAFQDRQEKSASEQGSFGGKKPQNLLSIGVARGVGVHRMNASVNKKKIILCGCDMLGRPYKEDAH